MYLNFYSLRREPFNITPDPDFLFLNESHKEALASIVYGIEKRKGFIAITGGIGLGKTTIVRAYLETQDNEHLKIIYVFNANITFKGLLRTIYQELELEGDDGDIFELVNRLHLTLIAEYEAGNNIVVIVDEAQNMPVETLENLRMLSNLETSTDKLIQIVFIGQPEFDALVDRPELRQLKQRIAIRATIQPLNGRESIEYITHRLNRAGLGGGMPFTDRALQGIAKGAKGVPRTINILCDNALITGFGCDQRTVGLKLVNEVLSDFAGEKPVGSWWPYIAAAAIALIIAVVFIFSLYGNVFIEWTKEVSLFAVSKPEAIRIPIKSGAELLEPTVEQEAKVVNNPMQREEAKTKAQVGLPGRTGVVASRTASSSAKSGQGVNKNRVSAPGSVSAATKGSEGGDRKSSVKADEGVRAVASSQVDIAKDVHTRLLEMIKQNGTVSSMAPGGK